MFLSLHSVYLLTKIDTFLAFRLNSNTKLLNSLSGNVGVLFHHFDSELLLLSDPFQGIYMICELPAIIREHLLLLDFTR